MKRSPGAILLAAGVGMFLFFTLVTRAAALQSQAGQVGAFGLIEFADNFPDLQILQLWIDNRPVRISNWLLLPDQNPNDKDRDGLTVAEETQLGTDEQKFDTDDDGLSDVDEVRRWHTDPRNPDSDCDGYGDGFEVVGQYYNPNGSGVKPASPHLPHGATDGAAGARCRWSGTIAPGQPLRTCNVKNVSRCNGDLQCNPVTDICEAKNTCVPDWKAGSWSACAPDGKRTRSYTDANHCGTNTGKPADDSDGEGCVPACDAVWVAGDWSACAEGQRTKTYVSSKQCTPLAAKPDDEVDSQGCQAPSCRRESQFCGLVFGDCCAADQLACANKILGVGSCRPACAPGTKDCPCGDGLTCTTGLACQSNVCRAVCVPNWQPTAWSVCASGAQTRTYTDRHAPGCNTAAGKPPDESRLCCGNGAIDADTGEQCDGGVCADSQACTFDCRCPAPCPAGTLNCPCGPNQTCTGGLQCNTTINKCRAACVSNWAPQAWSQCASGGQRREYRDTNNCSATPRVPDVRACCGNGTLDLDNAEECDSAITTAQCGGERCQLDCSCAPPAPVTTPRSARPVGATLWLPLDDRDGPATFYDRAGGHNGKCAGNTGADCPSKTADVWEWCAKDVGRTISRPASCDVPGLGRIQVNDFPLTIYRSMTVEAWINARSFPQNQYGFAYIAVKENSQLDYAVDCTTPFPFGLGVIGTHATQGANAKKIQFYVSLEGFPNTESASVIANNPIELGTIETPRWYHVIGVWDGTNRNVRLYVNGQSAGPIKQAAGGKIVDTIWPISIGHRYSCADRFSAGHIVAFDGTIRDVAIYNRALSLPEIETRYAETRPCSGPGCQTAPARCGDGVMNGADQCDAGYLNGTVCAPSYGNSCAYCSTACTNVTVPPAERCGDGVINGAEACDARPDGTIAVPGGGTRPPQSQCPAAGGNYYLCVSCSSLLTQSCPTCTSNWSCPDWTGIACVNGTQTRTCTDTNNCSTPTSNPNPLSQSCTPPAVCGNGIKEGTEQCDRGASNTNTACTPPAGGSCTYCSTECTTKTAASSCRGKGSQCANKGECCQSPDALFCDTSTNTCQPEPTCSIELGKTCGGSSEITCCASAGLECSDPVNGGECKPLCTCTWSNGACGSGLGGGCAKGRRSQTRSCTPSDCNYGAGAGPGTRCVFDSTCSF